MNLGITYDTLSRVATMTGAVAPLTDDQRSELSAIGMGDALSVRLFWIGLLSFRTYERPDGHHVVDPRDVERVEGIVGAFNDFIRTVTETLRQAWEVMTDALRPVVGIAMKAIGATARAIAPYKVVTSSRARRKKVQRALSNGHPSTYREIQQLRNASLLYVIRRA